MLSRWRRRNSFPRQPDSPSVSPFLERKIHPDLNSLAEELASSQGHGRDSDDRASEMDVPESLELGPAGFVGLRPSVRSRDSQKEAYREDKDNMGLRTSQNTAERNHIEAYTNPLYQQQKEVPQESTVPGSPSYFTRSRIPDQSVDYSTKTSSIMRWSTFGNHPHRQSSEAGIRVRSASNSTTQSSPSQSQSLVTCPSGFPPDSDQPPTPVSQKRPFYTSTPHSRSTSSNSGRDTPSAHTFGMPTPPRPESKHEDSYFTFKENPPPLPPLDHPAFRNVPNMVGLSSNIQDVRQFSDVDENGKFTRHAHSLPSLKMTRSRSSTRTRSTTGPGKKETRPRSKSSTGTGNSNAQKVHLLSEAAVNKIQRAHSRNQSKSSIASSRRSSAEYSAKEASSIGDGHERVHDGCWEVQVSKEMVRLALGVEEVQRERVETKMRRQSSTQERASSLGRARGKNVGSHVLLSVTQSPPHRRYLPFPFHLSCFFHVFLLAVEWRGIATGLSVFSARCVRRPSRLSGLNPFIHTYQTTTHRYPLT
ncbi:hypothetical protein GALMADRAFT_830941 [Galerina marginata CBS 339.88]|uniref:Uncharacterized protein n=1 Tax=Galerina marginata (strain CBS 339.88) TaxID=685588 RepID=A0A067TH74_GALM3|nr:hypothetical protein GALMADRAFT_830941 [Galerina marginata CBS 339.88]